MNTAVVFRSILITSILSAITSIILGVYLLDALPADLFLYLVEEYDLENPADLSLISSMRMLYLSIVIIVAIAKGIWSFKNWARKVYTAIFIILMLITPFDPVVMNGWEAFFSDLWMMLNGALILMMFSGSIRKRFSDKSNLANQ